MLPTWVPGSMWQPLLLPRKFIYTFFQTAPTRLVANEENSKQCMIFFLMIFFAWSLFQRWNLSSKGIQSPCLSGILPCLEFCISTVLWASEMVYLCQRHMPSSWFRFQTVVHDIIYQGCYLSAYNGCGSLLTLKNTNI